MKTHGCQTPLPSQHLLLTTVLLPAPWQIVTMLPSVSQFQSCLSVWSLLRMHSKTAVRLWASWPVGSHCQLHVLQQTSGRHPCQPSLFDIVREYLLRAWTCGLSKRAILWICCTVLTLSSAVQLLVLDDELWPAFRRLGSAAVVDVSLHCWKV